MISAVGSGEDGVRARIKAQMMGVRNRERGIKWCAQRERAREREREAVLRSTRPLVLVGGGRREVGKLRSFRLFGSLLVSLLFQLRSSRLIDETMDGSDKDREGSRDLMRGRSMTSRYSPATRQQPMGSSPTVSNDNDNCSGGDRVDATVPMVRWKKEKVRASRWKSSNKELSEPGCSRLEGEDSGHYQSMHSTTPTSLTSRKKARLQRKATEDSDAVDPAPVPRKLRSAINKRSSLSSSPTTPNAKRKHHHSSNGQLIYQSDGRRCKENVLFGSFTKDEEEVVEALCALSRLLPIGEQILDKEDRRESETPPDKNANSATCSDVVKEEGKSITQQPVSCEIKCHSSGMEKPNEEPRNDEHASSKQYITDDGRPTVDSNLNRAPEPGSHVALSENKQPENTPFRNLMKFSSATGVLPHHFTRDKVMQLTKCDTIATLPACKSDVQQNGCAGSATPRHEVLQTDCSSESNARLLYLDGTVPPHIQCSSNSAVRPDIVINSARLPSSGIELPTTKVPRDITLTWKKCTIHASVCHLIRSYQDKEKQGTQSLRNGESKWTKSKDGTKLCAPANNERAGSQSGLDPMSSAANNGSAMVERNKHEGRNETLCNGRFLPAHQSPILLEAKQKQACDFLSLSAGDDTSSSANGVNSGKLPSPFLHAQVPHHSLVPFPFPHVPYAPPYSEKLLPVATQQVQLQVPHFIGNRFYRPQMDNTMGNIQMQQQYQQQHLWQAQYARYSSPVIMGVSQGDWIHDPSTSTCQIAQTSTVTSSPSIQMQGGSYHPPVLRQHRQLITNASSSSSSKAKPHQNQQLRSLQ
ncbi:hypothetical protein Cni_G06929 [Canna indica]|uniref:Uncharacterized protein n=1 Tax=Canna indica TaxID=4628 RepID=A0AAQ3JZI3_9LILI|nr:hypothetical protein Cni_G06929 [Canna indica]